MKKRCTEEQVIAVLREAEAVVLLALQCRKQAISEISYYRRRSKVGWYECLGG